ncbi:hypothetical protein IWW50_003169 [Coemansia erecta]|nr:hypothetical protein IWW50_003169 [Coemansia erecta]
MAVRPFPELASADNSRSASPAHEAGKAKAKGRYKKQAPKAVAVDASKTAGTGAGRAANKPEDKPEDKHVGKPAGKANGKPATDVPDNNASAGRRKHKPRKPKAGAAPQRAEPNDRAEPNGGTELKDRAGPKDRAEPEAKRAAGSRRKHRRKPGKKAQAEGSPATSRASSVQSGPLGTEEPPRGAGLPVATRSMSAGMLPAATKSMSAGLLSTATIVAGANGRARVQLGRLDEYQAPLPGMGAGPRFVSSHVIQQRRSSTGHYGAYGAMGLPTPGDSQRQRSLTSTPTRAYFAEPQSAPADNIRGRSFSASLQAPHSAALHGAFPGQQSARHGSVGQLGYFASRRASVSAGLAVDPSHSIRIPTIMFQRSASGSLSVPPSPAHDGEAVAMRRLQDMIASVRAAGKPEKPVPAPPTPAAHPSARFDSILEEDEDTDDDDALPATPLSRPMSSLSRPRSSLCA